jgi:uncharacterized protein YegP (UPF0339 family)
MRYESKKCKGGGWFWRIVADNRKVLARSVRIYKSKYTCMRAMLDVKQRSMYCEMRVENGKD